MVLIVKKGTVPPTPHTEFYAIPKVLTKEEIHGSYGFSGAWSRKIHVRFYPTEQVKPPKKSDFALVPDFPPEADVLQPYHIFTGRMPHEGDAIRGRKPIVHGTRTTLSISKPTESMPKDTFFRNGERHEVYFVQDGEGVVRSEYGDLKFRKNVYVAMPKGTTYRIELASPKAWFLLVESMYPINFAPHYFNKESQATLMSPVVEEGSFTFHPGSTPHSPQGKAAERSLAARGKVQGRLAVMLDTYFESMRITTYGFVHRDPSYVLSWAETAPHAEAKGEGWESP